MTDRKVTERDKAQARDIEDTAREQAAANGADAKSAAISGMAAGLALLWGRK